MLAGFREYVAAERRRVQRSEGAGDFARLLAAERSEGAGEQLVRVAEFVCGEARQLLELYWRDLQLQGERISELVSW